MKLTTTAEVSVDGVMQGARRAGRGRARHIRARRRGHEEGADNGHLCLDPRRRDVRWADLPLEGVAPL
jgi:hypothetical protein